jgi:synaptobrevin family protein YKT6
MLARAASGGKQNADNDVECRDHATLAAPSWIPLNSSPVTLSKMDIVQALAVTMIRRARPEMDGEINVVINMDLSMIYPPLRPKDDSRRTPPSDILGNSSVFLQIRGTDFHPHDVVHNARLLRRAINEFRANARGNVSAALRKTAAMSSLPKTAVHAAFILHGTREKLASCTAVASFPVDTISFEGVAPAFHWVDSHVGFDWWSIVSRVSGELTPGMDGWVVTMNVPEAARDRIAGYMKLQQDEYFCHAYNRDGLVGIAFADREYPVRAGFSVVNKVLDDFESRHGGDRWRGARSDTFTEEDPELQGALQRYQDPLQADKLTKIQQDLDETKIILHKTIESVLDRGEKLDNLVDKSNDLSMASQMFYKQARKTNSCCNFM